MTSDSPAPDHVVVGAGAAGCVVAARLSAAGRRVLVLEAGPMDDAPDTAVPFRAPALLGGPMDWGDTTVPQRALDGRRVPTSTGRVVGGGGTINFLAWVRGNRADYDGWADAGMTGWSWADVEPCFRRIEAGPIAVTTVADPDPLSTAFVDAAVASGLARNPDVNGAEQDGAGPMWSNVRRGARNGTARGYLRPALGRPNLTLVTGARVQRLIVHDGRATGVSYRDDGGSHTVHCGSILLCAGALRSPQLLMLSGVGPADHLRAHGIEVVVDSPGVGAHLRDHPTAVAVRPTRRPSSWMDADTAENRLRWRRDGSGPLASMGQAVAFLRVGDGAPAPDVQLTPMLQDVTGQVHPGWSCAVTLLTPRSHGTVRLVSADPADAPAVDPDHLADPDDRRRLADGLRRLLEITEQPALRELLGPVHAPAPDADPDAYLRATLVSMSHPVGTCRAGTDPRAVVGPDLAVHGVGGLRVVDASVMPSITRGNTHAPSVMIGERACDLLLDS